jgi:hypothetical protein
MRLCPQVLEGLVVGLDDEVTTEKVMPPEFQSVDNFEVFALVHRVVTFSGV